MRMPTSARTAVATASAAAILIAALAVPTTAQDEARSIAVITPDYAAQPAVKEAVDLFISQAQERGYEVSLTDTDRNNAAISGEITTAVAQEVDAIVTAFGTPQEFGEGLANADAAGVPVFGLDTGGLVEPTIVNVTTDPGVLGSTTAQAIIDALGGEGQVAMIHFDPFEPVRLRAVTARELFEANGIEIVEYVQGSGEDPTGVAREIVLDLLVKYPEGELDAVWAGWDAAAQGAHLATQDAGRTEVLITGVDGQDFARAEVAKGENWIATVRQDWPVVASTLLDIIDAELAGEEHAEGTIYVDALLITAENAQ